MIKCTNRAHLHGGTGYILHKDECIECIADERERLKIAIHKAINARTVRDARIMLKMAIGVTP